MLLVGALLIAGAARAQNICPNNILPLGNGESLAIDKECRVGNGTYKYADINIIAGGSLIFDEVNNSVIDFWARSIIIENEGKLIAGSPNAPFGSKDGQLTIHLWGSDQGVRGPGAVCKSPLNNNSPCGIPSDIWKSNGAEKVRLAGGEDYFYQYAPLPFDPPGYFGYKVLAVSYGGTLQLFGVERGNLHQQPRPQRFGSELDQAQGHNLTGGRRAWRSPVRSTGVRTTVSSSRPPTTYQTIQRNWYLQ